MFMFGPFIISHIIYEMDEQENKWKSYTIKYKLTAVQIMDDLMSKCLSICQACINVKLPHFYYSYWKENIKKFDSLEASLVNINGAICQLIMGCPSFLEVIQEDLSHSIITCCERGLQVTTRLMLGQAFILSSEFKNKSISSKKAMVCHFVKKLGLADHIATDMVQKSHHDTVEEAKNLQWSWSHNKHG